MDESLKKKRPADDDACSSSRPKRRARSTSKYSVVDHTDSSDSDWISSIRSHSSPTTSSSKSELSSYPRVPYSSSSSGSESCSSIEIPRIHPFGKTAEECFWTIACKRNHSKFVCEAYLNVAKFFLGYKGPTTFRALKRYNYTDHSEVEVEYDNPFKNLTEGVSQREKKKRKTQNTDSVVQKDRTPEDGSTKNQRNKSTKKQMEGVENLRIHHVQKLLKRIQRKSDQSANLLRQVLETLQGNVPYAGASEKARTFVDSCLLTKPHLL